MAYSLQFCGAARTVTGSKHLLTIDGKKILIDCGLFQGPDEIEERNIEPFPFDPRDLDAVVITHAHLDHIGMLPKLVKDGYNGPIYATHATIGLAKVSLPDSGRLQEEAAERRRRKGLPNVDPYYTESQAYVCLRQFSSVNYWDFKELPGGATFRYMPAGHILGSAFAEIYFPSGERILMGGDLGRYDTPIIKDPTACDYAEYLVVESTYGDRLHADEDPQDRLEQILSEVIANKRCMIVPSFAIGRTQELLYHIKRLQVDGRIGDLPIYVDSPMATSASQLYLNCLDEHDKEMKIALDTGDNPLDPDHLIYVRDRNQSKALNDQTGPMVIIAGSGMANGGRVVHHLANRISDPSTLVMFTGYQAEGTMGRRLIEGADMVRLLGHNIPVRAEVDKINSLSAHADQGEIMRWLSGFKTPPKMTYIVHGEAHAQDALKTKIETELGWTVHIPEHMESVSIPS